MVNKTKIFSELSKMAVDAMSTFSGIKKEVETIVSLRVNKVINKMKLVKQINNARKFNLDKKNLFISLRDTLENESK